MNVVNVKSIDISFIPEILAWDNNEKLSRVSHIKEAYLEMAHKELNKLLNEVATENNKYLILLKKLENLSKEELDCFLYIPEISNKIFRRKNMDKFRKADFILKVLEAEIAKKEEKFDINLYHELWTGDGAMMMQYDEKDKEFSCFCADTVLDTVIVDFFSPFNRLLVDMNCPIPEGYTIASYSFEESEKMFKKVSSALVNANVYVHDFIREMVAVIMMKKFESEKKGETLSVTSSNGAYIGRVLFGHVDGYSDEELIDALVHESIHSLLYMVDDIEQWMPKPDVSVKIGRIIKSPWTGNMLTVRTILQAVFVWYGLYKFWVNHAEVYDAQYVEQRIAYIKNGFVKLDMNENEDVSKVTLETISRMKNEVLN